MSDSSFLDEDKRRVPTAIELEDFDKLPENVTAEVRSFARKQLELDEADVDWYLQKWQNYVSATKESPDATNALLLQFKEGELSTVEFHDVIAEL